MKKFKYQVRKSELINPICIKTFKRNGISNDAIVEGTDMIKRYLETAEAKFNVAGSRKSTKIFTEEGFLED